MPHPLEQKLNRLRRGVRRHARLRGACVAASALVGAMLVWGVADALIHFEDRGLRIMASLSALGALFGTLYRWRASSLRMRLSDVELAGRVRKHFPQLGDKFLSAVEFLHVADDDPTAGSVALRRAVIAEAATEAERVDFLEILDPRPVRRAAVTLAAIGLAAGMLMALNPSAFGVAVARLANPWGDTAWPRENHGMIRRPPDRVAFQIEAVTVRLTPPAYTNLPPSTAERSFRALEGTRAELVGAVSAPMRSVVLCLDDGQRIDARLGDDRRTFAAQFVVEKSGAYWFELTDSEGLTGGDDDRWDVQAVADAPPTVTLEQPGADLFVAPGAVVPLRIAARDDLALSKIAIAYRMPDADKEVTKTFWTTGKETSDARTVEGRWDLGPLGLRPGMQITFCATAEDFRPQIARSGPRTLSIITVEELRDRIAEREKIIVGELHRALKIEQGCRAQIEAFQTQHPGAPRSQAEVDLLQAIEHHQRDADEILTGRGEGVPTHVAALLADLETNRVANDDLSRRMTVVMAEIDRLAQERLPEIDRSLTAAVKTAQVIVEGQGNASSEGAVADSLSSAAGHQDAVVAALTGLIDQLARWDHYRRFARDMGKLLGEQEDVARRTAEVGRRTLAQDRQNLVSQDVAALGDVAGRQLDLARLLDRLLQEMDQAGPELQQEDPTAAQAVAGALTEARRLAISGQMRSVGRQIDQNQIGRAASGQKQISSDLRTVLAALVASSGSTAKGPAPSNGEPTSEDAASSQQNASSMPGNQPASNGPPQATEQPKTPQTPRQDMQNAMRRFWGELPEHVRERMLQLPPEEFPPKYQRQIEAYYRKIAEMDD